MTRRERRIAAAAAIADALRQGGEPDAAVAGRIGWPRQRLHSALQGRVSLDALADVAAAHGLRLQVEPSVLVK